MRSANPTGDERIVSHVPLEESGRDEDLLAERLSWRPIERLRYLLDMLEFEERARRAVKLPKKP